MPGPESLRNTVDVQKQQPKVAPDATKREAAAQSLKDMFERRDAKKVEAKAVLQAAPGRTLPRSPGKVADQLAKKNERLAELQGKDAATLNRGDKREMSSIRQDVGNNAERNAAAAKLRELRRERDGLSRGIKEQQAPAPSAATEAADSKQAEAKEALKAAPGRTLARGPGKVADQLDAKQQRLAELQGKDAATLNRGDKREMSSISQDLANNAERNEAAQKIRGLRRDRDALRKEAAGEKPETAPEATTEGAKEEKPGEKAADQAPGTVEAERAEQQPEVRVEQQAAAPAATAAATAAAAAEVQPQAVAEQGPSSLDSFKESVEKNNDAIELQHLEKKLSGKAADKIRSKLKGPQATAGASAEQGKLVRIDAIQKDDPDFKKMQELRRKSGDIPSTAGLNSVEQEQYDKDRAERDALDIEHRAMQQVESEDYRAKGQETPPQLQAMLDGHDAEIMQKSKGLAALEEKASRAAQNAPQQQAGAPAAQAGAPAGKQEEFAEVQTKMAKERAELGMPTALGLDKQGATTGPEKTWFDRNTPTFKRLGSKLLEKTKEKVGDVRGFIADAREGFKHARAERAATRFERRNGELTTQRTAYAERMGTLTSALEKNPTDRAARQELIRHARDGSRLDSISKGAERAKAKQEKLSSSLAALRAKRASPAATAKAA